MMVWGRQHHGLGDGVTDSRSGKMAVHTEVSTGVRNDDVEAPGMSRQWHGGSREVSMTTRALGRSMMVWALGKFSVGG
jgi:hypothetical protein